MNGKVAKRLRRLAKDQTNQSPKYFEETYKRFKHIFSSGSANSKSVLRKAMVS